MQLDNKVYDILKWVAQIVLPAAGTLYFALSSIWGLPYGEQIVGTLTAIDAFLGALLGISNNSFKGDGTLHVDTSNPEKDVYSIELEEHPNVLADKDKIVLKVDHAK